MRQCIFEFSRHADRMFSKLPARVRQRILGKMSEWERLKNPLAKARRLRSARHMYKFRVGDYRVVCSKEGSSLVVLVVVKVGHRKDVYNN